MDDRILKLIQLAKNNPNSNEADSALRKAQEILNKKNIKKNKLFLPVKEIKQSHRSIAWSDFFKIEKDPMIHLQIIPDRTVDSGINVESILYTFHSMYESFLDRVWNDGLKIVFKTKDFASFRILYQSDKIVFYIVIPSQFRQNIINSIYKVWVNATVKEVDIDYTDLLDPVISQTGYLELKQHFFKSTLVDRTLIDPMPSLMSVSRNIINDDLALLDVTMIPINDKKWQKRAIIARNKFKLGVNVKKPPKNLTDIFLIIGDFIVDGVIEKTLGFFDSMTGTQKKTDLDEIMNEYDGLEVPSHFKRQQHAMLFRDKDLKPSSEQKSAHSGFETVIRIVSQSEQKQRAIKTMTAIGTAFKDLSSDNEFEIQIAHNPEKIIRQLKNNKLPLLRLNGNILSIPETSQIFQLPSAPLQEEYSQIESIKERQINVDKAFLNSNGIELGEVKYRDEVIKVYSPVQDRDERVLPRVGVGGMGVGKTKGLISNWAIEAVKKGFGALVIDPNKKEVREQVELAIKVGYLSEEQVEFIDLGLQPFSLDWCEAIHDRKVRARLAGTAIDFFHITDDTTGQTERFLRSAIMAMKTGRISEIIEIFENEISLVKAIEGLDEGMNKMTLREFQSYQPAMRRKILSPIYNRLNVILSDPHLAECMVSENSLDMVEIMSRRKLIVVDVSTMDLDKIAINVIVNLLSSKIDLAMRLRTKIKGSSADFPFYIMLDEPHQYLRSIDIWQAAIVESRKWNVGYFFTFHYWEQLPDHLQKAIKNALPHYHIYTTSSETWKLLKDVIKPFTVEDGLGMKRWYAVNVIRAGGENARPFIAKMLASPEKRFKIKEE